MTKMTGKIFSLVIVGLCLMTFFHPDNANALWSKRFGTTWNDYGTLVPATGGGYYLSMISSAPDSSSDSGKQHLLFSKLDSSGTVEWTSKIYIGDYDVLTISEMGSGSFLVQGETQTSSTGPSNVVLAEFNVNGSGAFTPVFRKTYGGTGNDSMGFSVSGSGDIVGAGTTQNGTDQDMWLMKVNGSTGASTLNKVFHYSSSSSAPDLLEITGGYMLCSSVANASSGGRDILVAKLDSSFNTVSGWPKVYGGSGVNGAGIYSISGGNYLLVGTTKGTSLTSFTTDIIVIKIDGSGNIVWGKKYASSDIKSAGLVFENTDGSLMLAGSMTSMTTFQSHILLMELTSGGAISWQNRLLVGNNIDLGYFTRMGDGTYLLSGSVESVSNSSDSNLLFGKFDSSFKNLWLRTFGGTASDSGMFYYDKASSQYILTGGTKSFGAGDMEAFGVILDSNGAYPGCPYINDVTLTEDNPSLTASDLGWTPTSASLSERTPPTSSDVTVTVASATITTADICTGTPGAGNLSITPAADFSSSGTQGGPFSPSSKDYTLQNTGGTSINWTASKGKTWVTLSNSGGTLAAGASTTVTVSINSGANSLTAGSYSDTVTFTNTTNGNGNTTRGVSLTVKSSIVPVISVTPPSEDYGDVKVKKSKTASFSIKNGGKANLSITSTNITGTNASMFTITSGGGSNTIKPGKSLTIKVGFKPTSKGAKSAKLKITSNDPVTPTLEILLSGTGQ